MSYNVTLSCCAQTPRSRRCSTGSRGRCAGEGHVSRVTCHNLSRVTCHEDCAQDGAGRVQAGQAALRLDQLQGGLHSRGLHMLADRGQYSTVLYSTISNIQYTSIRQVEYNIYDQNQSVVATAPGKLFPNVKGCGYPPIVDCDGNNVARVVVTCSHVQPRADTCRHVCSRVANPRHVARLRGDVRAAGPQLHLLLLGGGGGPRHHEARLRGDHAHAAAQVGDTRPMARVTCHVSSLAIPVPVFTLAVCYLVFAYIHIYRDRPQQPPDKLMTVTFSRYLPPSIIHLCLCSKIKGLNLNTWKD